MADSLIGDADSIRAAPSKQFAARIAIGLIQGLAAWLLLELAPGIAAREITHNQLQWWPYRHPAIYAILTLITAFVPVVALAEIGRMRSRLLGVYLSALAAGLAMLAAYDIWRDPLESYSGAAGLRIWPSSTLIFCAGFGTFIVNQLLEHRERGGSIWEGHAEHFEDSWMRGVQFVLALVFTLLVWSVLELGNSLFGLIHLDWFGQMLQHNWFRCPVLAVAFAASVHITDVRPAILNGMRNLGLTLLSWLLPMVVLLGWAFLVALLFTGLAPLWGTRFAATILLSAVAVTLVLLNSAYKDGDAANPPPAIIRWAGSAAAPMMLLLTLLAAYAIGQRVWQYGWTPMRLRSAMVAAIALFYAIGYCRAAVVKGHWLKRIEPINVAASLGIIAVLVLKLTPIADPARIAVNSQVARLASGTLAADKFDYQFLRFDAVRYGTEALAALSRSANANVASRARLAQAEESPVYSAPGEKPDSALTEAALTHATVYPQGATLPDSFRQSQWPDVDYWSAGCLKNGSPCDIIILPSGDADAPLLMVVSATLPSAGLNGLVLGQNAHGKWQKVGSVDMLECAGVLNALRHGAMVPARPLHDDFIVNGLRLTFSPEANDRCPVQQRPKSTPVAKSSGDPTAPAGMGPAFRHPGGV